ncbi:MAG: hypothetical protein PHS60_16480, partial [Zavarzinia sp.]|nr:hypothetical protein [Zavarzinia sp.]
EHLLGRAAAIDVGRVEQRDPGIEGGRDPAAAATPSIFMPKLLQPSPKAETARPERPTLL